MAKLGIKDIARISGVSPATVSRTLRNPELVSKDTRRKVMKAVKDSGYKPNRFGASLRTQKSGNIVAVMPDITKQVNANIIRAIEEEAHKAGYSVLLGDTQGQQERERHYIDMAQSGQADGILLFTFHTPAELEADPKAINQLPPLVNSCETIDVEGLYQVMIDNVAGAKTAVNHLIELGHTRIAAITGPDDTPSSLERLQGFKQALLEAGLDYDPALVISGDYTTDSGSEATEKLLRMKQRPTAIFCFSDDMAFGAINTLTENDFSVPEDISIMGFDDIQYARLMSPALTTIRQPLQDIGTTCMQVLLKQLSGNPPAKKYYELPHELIVRQSTGPVAG